MLIIIINFIVHMQLSLEIAKWLQHLKVIGSVPAPNGQGKVTLDENLTRQFMNGVKVAELVRKISY